LTTVPQFLSLLMTNGSDVRFRRSESMVPCPCRTPEGFRDPVWHLENPSAPVCDANGMLPDAGTTTDIIVKAFMQPIQSTRATRLSTEQLLQMFGEIQADDHLGIFPYEWSSVTLSFRNWGRAGEDFVEYNGQRFICINANLIPDPSDGNPAHHWEGGFRLIGAVPA
jgi:hypothetical protein